MARGRSLSWDGSAATPWLGLGVMLLPLAWLLPGGLLLPLAPQGLGVVLRSWEQGGCSEVFSP